MGRAFPSVGQGGVLGRALIAGMAVALACGSALGQALTGAIEQRIARARIADAVVGVTAVDLSTGRVVVEINAQAPMVPASNQKLLAAGAALLTLGPGYTFQTALKLDGDRVVLVGSGDPSLGDPELLTQAGAGLSAEGVLAALSGAVKDAGPGAVREVVVDDRVFDRQLLHPSWDPADVNKSWSAEVSGVCFHANTLAFFVEPGAEGVGAAPRYRVEPRVSWIEVTNRGRTVEQTRHTAWVSRSIAGNAFTILGNVRYAAQVPIRVPFFEAPSFIGRMLAERLSAAGVRTAEGRAPGVRLAEPTERLEGGRTVAVVNTPLADVVRRCLVDSQNLYAEALLKLVGHQVTGEPGSWSSGGAVVRMLISDELGAGFASGTIVADGSGLSDQNRVSPMTMARWLAALHRHEDVRAALLAALPTEGEGTLSRRFRDTELAHDLRAKTGTIDGVRCLSGYLLDETGTRGIAFSILVNGLKPGEAAINALRLHEGIVAEMDAYLTQREPARDLGG